MRALLLALVVVLAAPAWAVEPDEIHLYASVALPGVSSYEFI